MGKWPLAGLTNTMITWNNKKSGSKYLVNIYVSCSSQMTFQILGLYEIENPVLQPTRMYRQMCLGHVITHFLQISRLDYNYKYARHGDRNLELLFVEALEPREILDWRKWNRVGFCFLFLCFFCFFTGTAWKIGELKKIALLQTPTKFHRITQEIKRFLILHIYWMM